MADEEQQEVIDQQEEVEQEEKVEEKEAPPEDWGEDISPDKDGGLFKRIVVAGEGEGQPLKGDTAVVHYTGRLLDGKVFDSSHKRNEPFSFLIGKGAYGEELVIKGWDVGILTMRKGEMSILTCKPEYAYGEKGSPPDIPPNATLQFDIELLSWHGEDITKDGGVMKSIVKEGDGYTRPSEGADCNVHVRGSYNGHVFDERDVSFVYGEGENGSQKQLSSFCMLAKTGGSEYGLLPGVEKAVGQMKSQESARVVVKPKYGFGNEGNPDLGIPGDAELIFELRLNSFNTVKHSWEYDSGEERKEAAEKLKERGSKYFMEGKYSLGQKLYRRGLDIVSDSSVSKEEDKELVRAVKLAFHLNLAACHLKMAEPSSVISECDKVLKDDSKNVKAYFRRGQARQLLQDYEEAIVDFQEVQKIEPTNKAAKAQIIASRNKLKSQRDREKKRFANMFDKFAAEDTRKQPAAAAEEPQQDSQKEEEEEGGGKEEGEKQEEVMEEGRGEVVENGGQQEEMAQEEDTSSKQ